MLACLHGNASERKLRLFAVACCRSIWHLLTERSRNAVDAAERYADGELSAQRFAVARAAASSALRDAKRAEYIAEAEANFQLAPTYRAACAEGYAACAVCAAVSVNAGRHAVDWNGSERVDGSAEAEHPESRHCHEWAALAHVEAERLALRVARNYAASRWGYPEARAEAVEPASLFRDIFGPSPFHSVTISPAVLAWNEGTVVKLAEAIYDERAFDRLPILADALEEAGCDNTAILDHCRGSGPHVRGCWALDRLLAKS
jgi:hypothetical protein